MTRLAVLLALSFVAGASVGVGLMAFMFGCKGERSLADDASLFVGAIIGGTSVAFISLVWAA